MRLVYFLGGIGLCLTPVLTAVPAALPETTTPPPTICKKEESGSDYLPNIYECSNTERCCNNEGAPSCCDTGVKGSAIRDQALMWGILIGVLLIVGIVASCYFKDRYCCDGEKEDDGGLFGKKKRFKKKMNVNETLYPHIAEQNRVEDPIFGETGKAEDVPTYAAVDEETRAKGKYI